MTDVRPRALVDVNLFVSYFLPSTASRRAIVRVFELATVQAFTLLLPEHLERELIDVVTTKQYLRDRIRPDVVANVIAALRSISDIVPKIEADYPAVTRDPKDDYLLAYASVGLADFLVTGDRDLLDLGKAVEQFRICTPAQFLALLGDRANDDLS